MAVHFLASLCVLMRMKCLSVLCEVFGLSLNLSSILAGISTFYLSAMGRSRVCLGASGEPVLTDVSAVQQVLYCMQGAMVAWSTSVHIHYTILCSRTFLSSLLPTHRRPLFCGNLAPTYPNLSLTFSNTFCIRRKTQRSL